MGQSSSHGKVAKVEDIPWYQPISGEDSDEVHLEFLTYLTACNGHFPFDFLSDVHRSVQTECLCLLAREFFCYHQRNMGLEQVFQNLQEIRCLRDIDQAVSYIIGTITKVLRCDRASYWMVDERRGFAWTKSATGNPGEPP